MVAYMEHKDLAATAISDERAREITDNVHRALDQLAQAVADAGRPEGCVQLLAATKTRDVGEVHAAIQAGIRLIGENRPQEILAKIDGLRELCAADGLQVGRQDDDAAPDVPLHLIGQLQSNKIGKILPFTNVIESVDSLDLAQKIARRAVAHTMTVDVLLEVNESGETSKSGCAPEQARDIAGAIGALDGVRLVGLMTVGAHVDDEAIVRQGFAHLRELRDELVASGEQGTDECLQLSMGMSGDAAWAIDEGSTQVRLGRAIFGERLFV
ncbi:YggS family pyridoxal phosphate-dependent enzyme [Bifidobacterium gallicum]|uniref:Pyridoxal phosphate homeostasis protein n=1 Tax=Bifidobacterium gallicum DSM 20093 = LMG 11596 TaxID=561180 RepID=D1NWK9_9BIFI|nr:YggS family pyridoxal phosphate-dependent enzyme [Bifidobacterium gallicum]EFA22495.1 pyridoxal phosphate enzyme, YggS family [Bifidobacterium gallicum DSM 20093 = LMG 11596]KFI59001.1 pyridoxal phosphate enzyme, YggS family [Bifidobacterium gallicum DSM 20093 = LMG 11596]